MDKWVTIQQQKLVEMLQVRRQTIEMYLCRAEFSHINKVWNKGQWWYEHITTTDLEKLRKLTRRKWNAKR